MVIRNLFLTVLFGVLLLHAIIAQDESNKRKFISLYFNFLINFYLATSDATTETPADETSFTSNTTSENTTTSLPTITTPPPTTTPITCKCKSIQFLYNLHLF